MSGCIHLMRSPVTIPGSESNQKVSEKRITTSAGAKGDAESRLKNKHVTDINDYAVSVFPEAEKKEYQLPGALN